MEVDSGGFSQYRSKASDPLIRDGALSNGGEIKKEFDVLQKQLEEEIQMKKIREAEASAEFIRKLKVNCLFYILYHTSAYENE